MAPPWIPQHIHKSILQIWFHPVAAENKPKKTSKIQRTYFLQGATIKRSILQNTA